MNQLTASQYVIDKKKKAIPLLLLLLVSIVWGSAFILIKKGLIAYSPLEVGTLRIIFAAIILIPVALKNLKPVLKENWKQLLILGLITNLIPSLLVATAGKKLDSSLIGILMSLNPLFTAFVGCAFYKLKANVSMVIGLTLGLIGSITLSKIDSNGEMGAFNISALYVIIAALLFGVSANMIKKLVDKINPVVLLSLVLLSILPSALGILFTTDFIGTTLTHPQAFYSLASTIGLGVLVNVFAFIIYNKLIQMTDAVFAATSSYLSPVVAIGWGVVDGEVLTPLHFAAMLIIATGILMINKKNKPQLLNLLRDLKMNR